MTTARRRTVRLLTALAGATIGFVATPAWAWNTASCPTANPSTGACTCVSNDVQTYGNYSPLGCDTQFDPTETIGVWQSINSAPTGTHTWTFDYGYKATEDSGWQSQFDTNQTVFNIGASYAFFNAWDNKFISHPGGSYRCQVYFDNVPVSGGYVEFAVCGSDYRRSCYQGDVFWFDACGHPLSKAQECGPNTCSGSTCACSQTASTACYAGDVWNLDCNDMPTSKKTECGAGSCAGGSCYCNAQTSSACYQGDVWWYDCNGSPSSAKTECGAGSCAGGSCYCNTEASSACYQGDVWWYDCNGSPSSAKTDCGAGTCAGGSCSCNAQASSACYQGDVWWYDCNGSPSSVKTDCGAGTCSGGGCQIPPPTGDFDPACIVSDDLFRDAGAMDVADLQAFLDTRGGRLSDQNLAAAFAFSYPGTLDYDTVLQNGVLGRDASPAEIIALSPSWGDVRINPRALIVTLQKEQSLIDSYAHATQSALDWATGYAVFEGSGPTPKYRGFFNQVIATAWQFDHDFEALAAGPQPAITIDGQTIVPKNRATAVLYKYTPHLSAAQTYWTLWRQYFGATGTCSDTQVVDPPTQDADPIELYCTHTGPYSVLAWPFEDTTWHVVPGSPYHRGDDEYADDWNTTLGGCDTEKALGPMWVHAVASGTVVFVGQVAAGYGSQVVVRLANDPTYYVRYAHLDDRPDWLGPWQVGDTVHLGDIIGAVGDTGTDCAHLHLVLYCAIDPGTNAATRLAQGRSPSGLSGGPSPHATWFRLDHSLGQDVGGAGSPCDPGDGPSDGDFIGQRGLIHGCTAAQESTALWFVGHAGQEVSLALALTDPATGAPALGLVELADDSGASAPTTTVTQRQGAHRVTAHLPADGRYWARVRPADGIGAAWRLTSDAVSDREPDQYDVASLLPPGTDAVHAIDAPGDVDVFLLGAVADRLTVRAEPTGTFPSPDLALDLQVIGDDGELAPIAGTWYADDAWQRTLTATNTPVYLVVTGAPGLYHLAVARPSDPVAEPTPDGDAIASDLVSTPRAAGDRGGCGAGGPLGGLAPLLLLLLALWRRRVDADRART